MILSLSDANEAVDDESSATSAGCLVTGMAGGVAVSWEMSIVMMVELIGEAIIRKRGIRYDLLLFLGVMG